MDRTEATGFGIAFAGHAALLAALALGFASVNTPVPKSEPIEVSLVEEVALVSASPTPSQEAPAPQLGEIEGPAEATPPPAPAPMPEPVPLPQVQPQPHPRVQPRAAPPAPAPTPRPVPRPQPKASPPAAKAAPPRPAPKAAPAQPNPKSSAPNNRPQPKAAPRPTGNLKGLLNGVGDAPSPSKSSTPPGLKASPAVQASLGAELRRQLKPHWRSPTGADVELLVTTVTVSLARDGSVASIGEIRTSGQTASNRSQVKLHQEHAVRAVRLAAPFRLPAEFYDAWKVIRPNFDRRLSQ